MMWPKASQKTSHSPLRARRRAGSKPVIGVNDVFVDDVDAARARRPSRAWRRTRSSADQAEPEDRHRIADQADDADDLVDRGCRACTAAQHAERHAEHGADERAERRQFERRREDAADVAHHRVGGQHRRAEIARAAPSRGRCRTARRAAGRGPAPRAPRSTTCAGARSPTIGQHRIDRHHAADEEGDGQQPEIGRDDDDQEAADRPSSAQRGARCAPRLPVACRLRSTAPSAAGYSFETLARRSWCRRSGRA